MAELHDVCIDPQPVDCRSRQLFLPVLARVSFCVVVPVLPFISILSAEKHDRIKWRSRQDGRKSTAYSTTPKTDGRTAETDGGRAKAD